MIYSCDFETNHNKDYSVVKTLGSLVLNGGFFLSLHSQKQLSNDRPTYHRQNSGCRPDCRHRIGLRYAA